MAGQNCSNCRAPLTLAENQSIITCPYCGTTNRAEGAPERRRRDRLPPELQGRLEARARTSRGPAVAGALLGVGIAVAAVIVVATRSTSRSPASGSAEAAATAGEPAGEQAVPLAKLSEYRESGAFLVDAPGRVGTLEAFEAVANLPWAVSIARAWSNDARLDGVQVVGVRPGGAQDLVNDEEAWVAYSFHSPARVASAENLQQVAEAETFTDFQITIRRGEIRGRLDASPHAHAARSESEPIAEPAEPPPASCTVARLLEIAVSQGLPPRPRYGLHLDSRWGRWRWTFSADNLDDHPPPVFADSCRLEAQLPEPGREDQQDLALREPFDWNRFQALAGCECPAAAPPVALAGLVDDASYSYLGGRLTGSFDLAWVLRAGDALPFRLAVDEAATAPPANVQEADSTLAIACDAERVAVFYGRRASAWSYARRAALWTTSLDAELQPGAPPEASELPLESIDAPLRIRCLSLPVTEGVAEVPVAGGVRRINLADGSAAPEPPTT